VFTCLLLLLTGAALYGVPSLTLRIFDASARDGEEHALSVCLLLYLFAAGMQQVQRMYAATKEARGLIWHNMVLEVLLILSETAVIGYMLIGNGRFTAVVFTDSLLIFLSAFGYTMYLLLRYPPARLLHRQSIKTGWHEFTSACSLYLSNFFEKLSTDGLVLLLSVFRFEKMAIALFATVRTIANTPLLAHNLLLNTYTPALQQDVALRDKAALERLLNIVRLRVGVVLLAGIVGCYLLYAPVFVYWTKGTIAFDQHFLMAMLLLTISNLFGLSFLFILKGLNLLPQLLKVMVLKTILVLLAFAIADADLQVLGFLLASGEAVVSFIVLPLVLYRFWQMKGMSIGYGRSVAQGIPYIVAALLLLFFWWWQSLSFTLNLG
jgi:hypothetical protein